MSAGLLLTGVECGRWARGARGHVLQRNSTTERCRTAEIHSERLQGLRRKRDLSNTLTRTVLPRAATKFSEQLRHVVGDMAARLLVAEL
jgi:DNA recombination-dependent growth factor C